MFKALSSSCEWNFSFSFMFFARCGLGERTFSRWRICCSADWICSRSLMHFLQRRFTGYDAVGTRMLYNKNSFNAFAKFSDCELPGKKKNGEKFFSYFQWNKRFKREAEAGARWIKALNCKSVIMVLFKLAEKAKPKRILFPSYTLSINI